MHRVERPGVLFRVHNRPLMTLLGRLLTGTALGIVISLPAMAGQAAPSQAGTPPAPPPETVIIQGDAPDDFRVEVPTLSRLTEPLLDIPQSIDVLPQELLRDRGITN